MKFKSKFNNQSGFALPSVLFIATILTVLIFSLIVLQYLRSKETLIETAKVKAMNAATSGIEKGINDIEKLGTHNSETALSQFHFTFEDGGESTVDIIPWGGYLLFQSEGHSGKFKKSISALIGYYPTREFSNALIFNNEEHQLILTGNISITGDVQVGSRGVTIGTLGNYQTPRRIPIDGNIKRISNPDSYHFDIDDYSKSLQKTEKLMQDQSNDFIISGNIIDLDKISEDQTSIQLDGNCIISGSLKRIDNTLLIKSEGTVTINEGTVMNGFVLVKAKGKIVVHGKTRLTNVIISSEDSIAINSTATITGQLFAPKIFLESTGHLIYPSIVCITASQENSALIMQSGAILEGTLLISSKNRSSNIDLESGSTIYGGIYSEVNLDFNSTLYGTLITKDFYFYDPPTQYYGWMRRGKIDRKQLPDGYMIPYGFSTSSHLGVIDWQ